MCPLFGGSTVLYLEVLYTKFLSFQDNLFEWEVELGDFPSDSLLAKDLQKYTSRERGGATKRKPVITMEMKFPKDYPMSPPFVRIIRPRFKFLTGN